MENRGLYADYDDFMQDCIQFKEDVSMVYAPMRDSCWNRLLCSKSTGLQLIDQREDLGQELSCRYQHAS